jgi:thiol-disulfide isomerase/thioredoxin
MKQIFSLRLAIVLFCLLSAFCAAANKQPTTVTCYLNNHMGSGIFLYRVEHGEAVSLGFKRVDDQNVCTFAFLAEKEGMYYLRRAGGHSNTFKYGIYLRPGDVKKVYMYISSLSLDFDSCQIDNPKKETQYLQQWTSLFNSICRLGSDRYRRATFFTAYDQFIRKADTLKKSCVTTNPYFDSIFSAKIDADIKYVKAGSFFYFGDRMNAGYDTSNAGSSFYTSLLNEQFCDPACLASECGIQLMNFTLGYRLLLQSGGHSGFLSFPLAEKTGYLCNDMVKGTYAAHYMQSITSYEQFRAEIEPFQQVIDQAGFGEAYKKKLDELTVFAKGSMGYNFSLPDTHDKLVSLTGFKGKVVVVDMWAMWCASCLQEKPFYEKTAEAFANRKDIVFLGVSVDGKGKKEPWKSFVARKGYKTMELLSEPAEALMKYYKIEGIPRYLVFDKEGRIITVDAPRPSTPAFQKLIEQILSTTGN